MFGLKFPAGNLVEGEGHLSYGGAVRAVRGCFTQE